MNEQHGQYECLWGFFLFKEHGNGNVTKQREHISKKPSGQLLFVLNTNMWADKW